MLRFRGSTWVGLINMGLRVVQVIGGLPIGGAERNLVNTFNVMDCSYRAAIFVGLLDSSRPSFYDQLDPKIEQYFILIRQRSLPIGIARLAAKMRELRIDVVHTHMFTANLYGTIAARLARIPVIVTSEHGENPWKQSWQRWLERRVISPVADARFCVSPQILATRRDVDMVPAEKLHLVVNGTPLPTIKSREVDNRMPVIGAVGRFIPAKDYLRLVDAVDELRRRGVEFRLVILGDGPEMGKVRGRVAELALEQLVQLPGMVCDVGHWYCEFDIYVSSSIREGQPMALLEAMAHGLPVVSTDVGAAAETVGNEVAGLIVPAGDTQALADALHRLVRDCPLRRCLARSARTRVESEFSIDKVASQMVDFYRQTLDRKLSDS